MYIVRTAPCAHDAWFGACLDGCRPYGDHIFGRPVHSELLLIALLLIALFV
ncbi:hypothetical protein [Paenibacillus sp. JZ16]|uniref:hypothetical protein n=1 Tax=Paenibacillus sp. JZ16 TaxID=1906272 RepID=UPI00188A75D5|nr:hypothetical protein [Paenibacillus sp. JZ16]